jgi:hypothetical protein
MAKLVQAKRVNPNIRGLMSFKYYCLLASLATSLVLSICVSSAQTQTVNDPGIKPGEVWNREKKRVPAPRTATFGRLNVAPLLAQGIGVATVYYGDIDPDFEGGIPFGVRALYLKPGQKEPAPDEWGAIAA